MGPTRYIAEFAPLDLWVDDETKLGYIRVIYDNQVVLARPIFQGLSFVVPTKEFVTKYRNYIRVIVEPLNNSTTLLGWSGFTLVDLPLGGLDTNYPYAKMLYMDEMWTSALSTKEDGNYFTIYHDDQTRLIFDRKKEDESITLVDGVHQNKLFMNKEGITLTDTFKNFLKTEEAGITLEDNFGNKIVTSSSGILIQDKFGHKYEMSSSGTTLDGDYIVLKKFTDWLQQNASNLGLGNLGAPVPVFPSALAMLAAGVAPGQNFVSNKPGGA